MLALIKHFYLLLLVTLLMVGCAHKTRVAPSSGHIDGKSGGTPSQSAASDIPKPVKSTSFVPPPAPKSKEQTYSIVVNEVPVKEILFALARESKLNVDIHPSIQGRVTLNAVDQTLPAILERLARQVNLTYKIDNNVLFIGPDLPVLRTYKVDYVNMSRDTTGFIGVAAEIAGTGRSASTGATGSASSTGSAASGGPASNSSRTQVASISKHHFWETLIANVKDILAETDKEVLISRNAGATAEAETPPASATGASAEAAGTSPAASSSTSSSGRSAERSAESTRRSAEAREDDRLEYKTLFAATVIANQEAGVITVRATSKQHEKVQEFLDKVMASVRRQVLIEATIVEVQLNDSFQAGIDWSRLAGRLVLSSMLGPQLATTVTAASVVRADNSPGLIAGYVNDKGSINASVQLLKQFGNTKVLSSPKLMVLNNQTAVLKVVDNLVYFTVQSQISQSLTGGAGTNLQSVTTTANTVPVGVVMSVTPQITDTGLVNINVRPTVSSLIRYVQDPNPQISALTNQGIPEIQVREMESVLQVNSGNTAILGGLMQDIIRGNTDRVPGLSNLPYAGQAFQGRSFSNKKTELVVFLRPTVIQNASLESEELQSFKQYLPSQQLQQTINESAH